MNPNALFFDIQVARQYIDYNIWLYNERIKNWKAYTTYLQATQLVQQQHLQLLQQQQQQQQQDEADIKSYIAEIDAGREKDLGPSSDQVPEVREDMREIAEERQTFKEQRRERVRIYHQDKRRSINEDKRTSKQTVDYFHQVRTNTPLAEVSRAEHFNADKPPRNQRYLTTDKIKGKKFYNRRKFGSGWAKQLE